MSVLKGYKWESKLTYMLMLFQTALGINNHIWNAFSNKYHLFNMFSYVLQLYIF